MSTIPQHFSPRSHREFSTIEALESRIAPAVIIVNNPTDTAAANKVDLRQALAQADTDLSMHPGVVNTIIFKLLPAPAHTENVITLGGTALTSNGDVNIIGPGAGKLIISGNGASGVFNFSDPSTTKDSPVSISGLSIVDGSATNGGGIYSHDSLSLKNVVVSGNSATDTAGVTVEGSAATGTKVSISNSLISGNAGTTGGGMALYSVKSFSVVDTFITGNSVGGDNDGGGLFAGFASNGTGGTIAGCVIAGNSAGGYGGGLELFGGSTVATAKITISGTKITGNTSLSTFDQVGGGGVFISGVNTVITGSTIDKNTAVYEGGGVSATGFTSLTITGSIISGNSTTKTNGSNQGGSGLFLKGSGASTPAAVKIAASHISDNSSDLDGGGILAENGIALSVTGSTLSGNHAASVGGGIAAFGNGANQVNLTATGSLFTSNTSENNGGAICMNGSGTASSGTGTVSLIGSKLTGNSTTGEGGAMDASTSGAVTLKGDTVTNNFCGDFGGGVAIQVTQEFLVAGGAFDGNSSGSSGGGLWFNGVMGTIQDATITGNAATQAGGGVKTDFTASTLTLKADNLFANTAPDGPDVANFSGTITFT